MKTLKIKLGLLSLLAVLAVSVFLTSCEQENVVSQEVLETADNLENLEQELQFWMPKGIGQSPQEASNYLNEVSENEFEILKENYRISEFLRSVGKFEGVYDLVPERSLFTDLQLENVLNETEYLALQKYQTGEIIESRGCYYEYCPVPGWCMDASPFPCGNINNSIHIYEKIRVCSSGSRRHHSYTASCYRSCLSGGSLPCYVLAY